MDTCDRAEASLAEHDPLGAAGGRRQRSTDRRAHRARRALAALSAAALSGATVLAAAACSEAKAQLPEQRPYEPVTDEAFYYLDAVDRADPARLDYEDSLHCAAALYLELLEKRRAGTALDDDEAQAFGWIANSLSAVPELPAGFPLSRIEMLEHGADEFIGHGMLQLATRSEWLLGREYCRAGRPRDSRRRLEQHLWWLEGDARELPGVFLELCESAQLSGDSSAADAYLARATREVETNQHTRSYLDQYAFEKTAAELAFSCAIQWGVPDHAVEPLNRLHSMVEASGDREWEVVVEAFDAEFAAATDDWDDVFEELDPLLAPPTVERLSPSLRATCRLLLGKAYAERAMTEPEVAELAVQHIEAALADPALSALERWNAENALADVERRSGDHRRAAELLAAALARLDDGSGASSFGEAALQASLANLALERGDGRAALERTLVDLERAYDKFLVEWSTLPQRRDGVAFLHFGLRQAIVGAVVRLTIAVDDENGAKRALAQLLRAQALGSLSRALGGPPATLDEATRELCGPRRGVLVYLPGPERSFAFAHDSAKTTCTELAASRWWSSTRSDWFALLSHSPRRDGAERAKEHARLRTELAAQLLPERVLARLAEWDELSIVGIDLLGYTPFEALPLSDGQTLGTRLACTYLPSLAVGCQLARALEARSLPPASLCLVAAPTDPPAAREAGFKWDAIAWNDDHVEPLREIYGKEKLFVFTGDKASLAALASGAARTSASLQIVAHGFYQRLAQPPPGLALAPSAESNGLVRCQELEQLALPPLVVLAVCGAGRGPLRSGDDGVTNLGGACFKAGAVCVLISPIDLEQTATEKLLDLFHERFAAGETPARAMLAARRALAADPRFADPFYHSMLQVVGIGHRPLVR